MDKSAALRVLAALSQETRLDIFRLLVRSGSRGMAAGTLAEALHAPSATLSFHLKELRNADVLDCRRDGRNLIYSPNFSTMNALLQFLMENCCAGDETRSAETRC